MKAWLGLLFLALVMAAAVFGCAGSVRYWQGWVYLSVFFVASSAITIFLMRNDPALLARRLKGGPTAEKEKTQQVIQVLASLGFIALLVVPGLDHRFGWSSVPVSLVTAADALVALSFFIIFLVYKENSFTSATIEISPGQTVITTGPYAYVRHPMYAGAGLLLICTPLALGSYWGLLAFAAVMPALIWRLLDEERFLGRNLPGYTEYCERIPWRLLPRIF